MRCFIPVTISRKAAWKKPSSAALYQAAWVQPQAVGFGATGTSTIRLNGDVPVFAGVVGWAWDALVWGGRVVRGFEANDDVTPWVARCGRGWMRG